jgi:hypothetical protein
MPRNAIKTPAKYNTGNSANSSTNSKCSGTQNFCTMLLLKSFNPTGTDTGATQEEGCEGKDVWTLPWLSEQEISTPPIMDGADDIDPGFATLRCNSFKAALTPK